MISNTTVYELHTGNLFGISMAWAEAFHNKAMSLAGDDLKESDWGVNPAFAGAWCSVFTESTAKKIKTAWSQMLPLAVQTMPKKWRDEYESKKPVPSKSITGTNCFVSFRSACQYYAVQEGTRNGMAQLVRSKEAEGAIQIGKPKLRKGQRLVLLDNNTRYGIEE